MRTETNEVKNRSAGAGRIELPLMEAFYTIQGEGANTGMPAYFIRLGGCDVGCHWCDVKESWDAGKHPVTPIKIIAEDAVKYGAVNAVITGGEPLMCHLGELTSALKRHGIRTFLETSGAYSLTGEWDWICLSPKKTKLPLEGIYSRADELKVIIYNNDDFRFAEEQAARVGKKCLLYLQPEWGRREATLPRIIDYVKANPKWKISLQTHKYIGIP
jgi:7-carboxy-7-deazaguanine synthase